MTYYIILLLLIIILLGLIYEKENFKILKYDPKKMDSYLTNTFSEEVNRKIAVRDFNSEFINYYKGPYNCLNFKDLLTNENYL